MDNENLSAPQPIHTRAWPQSGAVALVSRSHPDAATAALLACFPQTEAQPCGSSLKFCRIAEGTADVYPRLGPTSEWDIAAGHALVVAAGGKVSAPDGGELVYGRAPDNFRVPGFVAWGDPGKSEPA
jgi:3'(2'), 5'-bisphosphate nucleotidase